MEEIEIEIDVGMFSDNPPAMMAIKAIEAGYSAILQAPAGNGKSTLLKAMKKHFKETHDFFICAPTGIAAYPIGGTTIHSLFGFNTKPFQFMQNGKRMDEGHPLRNPKPDKKQILVMDEFSMIRSDLMNQIDKTLRMTFEPFLPFGGIQILLIGDMAQLPPVVNNNNEFDKATIDSYKSRYFFDCPGFGGYDFVKVELTRNYRQKGDLQFYEILQRMRLGETTWADINLLNERVSPRQPEEVTICAYNKDAQVINEFELNRIDSKLRVSKAEVTGKFPTGARITPEELSFKIGARVMFTKNQYMPSNSIEEGSFLNGETGMIVDFDEEKNLMTIDKDKGGIVKITPYKFEYMEMSPVIKQDKIVGEEWQVVGSMKQFAIALAWAITGHKSQGMTFPKVHINLGKTAFESGQAYVMFSRCETLDGITLERKLRTWDIKTDNKVLDFIKSFSNESVTID